MQGLNVICVAGALLLIGGCGRRQAPEPLQVQTVAEDVTYELPAPHEGCTRRRTLSLHFDLQSPANDAALEAWVVSLVGGEEYERICQTFFLPGDGLKETPFAQPETLSEAMSRIAFGGMKVFRPERETGDELDFAVPCKGECRGTEAGEVNVKCFQYGMNLKLVENDLRFCSCEAMVWQAPFGSAYGRDVRGVFDRVTGKRFTFDDLIHPRKREAFKKFFSVYLHGGSVDAARAAEMEKPVEIPEEKRVFFNPAEREVLNERNTLENFTFTPEGVFWSEIQDGRSYFERLFPWEVLRPYLRDKTLADRFRRPPQKCYPQK